MFSFDITLADLDTDLDGLPDRWGRQMFGNLNQNAMGDFDNDGLSNLAELQAGTRANTADSDDDGYYDGQEVAQNIDPLSAAAAPAENFADQEDAAVVERPVALFQQSKTVTNHWYSGYAAPSSDVSWYDYAGASGQETYQGATQRWEAKLGSLSYPEPSTSPFNYYDTGFSHMAVGELRESQSGSGYGASAIGYANALHSRVGLYSNPNEPPQPWLVCRKFLTYRKTLPSPNPGTTPPVFSAVDVVPLFIQPGANRTMTNAAAPPTFRCLLMEPEPAMALFTREYVGQVTATPISGEGLALDETGQELWVTLPSGGDGVQMLMHGPVDLDQITFKVQGGDVTPATSTNPFSNWPFYYESYSGSTVGTASALHPALNDGTGNLKIATRLLLKFDVKQRRNLTITIQPIGLVSGNATANPQSVPAPAELKEYLDSVFGPQANVDTTVNPIRPQVNVAFDVGLGVGYGDRGKKKDSAGVLTGDGKLSILQGHHGRKGVYSAEETAILHAPNAAPDPDAAITIYWVAGNGMDAWHWADVTTEQAGSAAALRAMPVTGWAGKATKSSRPDINPGPRVIWINGLSQDQYSTSYATMLWVVAHEMGHALGDIGHTTDKYETVNGLKQQMPSPGNTGFSIYSDNTRRLMTGMQGERRRSGPKQLNKFERDRIGDFDDYD